MSNSNQNFDDLKQFLNEKHGLENWVTVYENITSSDKSESKTFYCALSKKKSTKKAMNHIGWDLSLGHGRPGFMTHFKNGKSVTTYLNGVDEEFRPLILYRDFEGPAEKYVEVNEEIRLLHNLCFDPNTSTYFTFDDAAERIDVIKFNQEKIDIRRTYLRSYLAAIQHDLLLFFSVDRHFRTNVSLSEDLSSPELTYAIYSGKAYVKGYTSFIRINGKKLIKAEPVETCGIWPYEAEKKYEEFIIGGDENNPKLFSSNRSKLADYFGGNPGAPHYLTPVFFKKDVLQKYYSDSRYSVQDGTIHKDGGWMLRLDNNIHDYVSVFLGDLGSDLPHSEQIYWKSYNLVPDGHRISNVNYQRSILGNFHDSESPDLSFKQEFAKFNKEWKCKYGWDLFLPLAAEDMHFLNGLRSLLKNDQIEFDNQILAIAKITIDSVNVVELRKFLGLVHDDSSTSIELLQLMFYKLVMNGIPESIEFIRAVQGVRSSGTAHRKGDKYTKAVKRLNVSDNLVESFNTILYNFILLLKHIPI